MIPWLGLLDAGERERVVGGVQVVEANPALAGVIARSRVEEPVVLQKPTNAILLNNRIAQSLGLIEAARPVEVALAAGATTLPRR